MGISTADVSGNIGLRNALSGLLNSAKLSGDAAIPRTLDRTAIHYDTTEAWNSMTTYIALEGHLYIYSDYQIIDNGDGTTTKLPAMKIGDGTTYLIDLPFTVDSELNQAIVDHMADDTIHVSTTDRTTWDSKVGTRVYGDTLYFTR